MTNEEQSCKTSMSAAVVSLIPAFFEILKMILCSKDESSSCEL